MGTAVSEADINTLWKSLSAILPNCPAPDQVCLEITSVM